MDIPWSHFPAVKRDRLAAKWLESVAMLGAAGNTIEAYGRGLADALAFARALHKPLKNFTRADIRRYVNDMRTRRRSTGWRRRSSDETVGLSIATMQQRVTVLRLFFQYLVDERLVTHSPVGRGRFVVGRPTASKTDFGLVPQLQRLPWIPNDDEWKRILGIVRQCNVRDKAMFALSYECALRRQEVCGLEISDFDMAARTLRVRAELAKNRRERIVLFSDETAQLIIRYFRRRRVLQIQNGRLFLSESRRNRGRPITVYSWTARVEKIAAEANVPRFTTHALRHLCLTDLARAGWDIHQIALFAGHKTPSSTMRYIHLSGRELKDRYTASIRSLNLGCHD